MSTEAEVRGQLLQIAAVVAAWERSRGDGDWQSAGRTLLAIGDVLASPAQSPGTVARRNEVPVSAQGVEIGRLERMQSLLRAAIGSATQAFMISGPSTAGRLSIVVRDIDEVLRRIDGEIAKLEGRPP